MGTDPKTVSVANAQEKKKADDFDLSTLTSDTQVDDPKPEAKPEVKPAAPVSKHPPRLRSKALSYGGTPEWIDSLETDDLVDRIREYEDQLRAQQQAKEKPPESKVEEDDDFQFTIENERDYDAEMVKLLKQTAKSTYKAATKKFDEKLKKEREEANKKVEQARTQAIYARIDEAFDDLPEALQKFVGQDNPAFQGHRNTIFQAAKIDPNKLPSTKKLTELLAKAGYKSYGIEAEEKKPDAEPEKTNGNGKPTTADYLEATLGKPTAVKARKTKGQEQADLEFAEAVRDMGFRGGRGNHTDLSGLPD